MGFNSLALQRMALDDRVQVRLLPGGRELSGDQQTAIDAVWQEQLALRGDSLFEGESLEVVGVAAERVDVRPLRYREYLAGKLRPEIFDGQPPVSLGVSGFLQFEGCTVLARRGQGVTSYAGWLELAPSGGVTVDCLLGNSDLVDFRGQLLLELEEEAGISPESVERIEVFAGITDPSDLCLDVCARLELNLEKAAVGRQLDSHVGDEYEEFHIVPQAEMPSFVEQHRETLLPTSLAMLELSGWIG